MFFPHTYGTVALQSLEHLMMKPYKTVLHAFLVLLSVGMPLPLIVNVQSADATEASTHHPHMRLGAKRILTHTSARTTGPMVQLDQQGRLHLVWTQDDKNHLNLYYLQAHLDDKMFPYPVRVNPNDLPVASLHEPPTLALSNDKTVFLTWTTPHPQANGTLFASLLELSRSIDGGKTFLAPVQVNDDTVVTSHAFDSLAVAQNGTVQIAWIDAREGNKDPSTYTARSLDQGQSITTNLKLDEQTCVCCRTTVTTGLDGTVYVAWRKIFPGNIREVVVARSTDNGTSYSSAVIVGHDQWMFLGCPHRPASLGVDANGRCLLFGIPKDLMKPLASIFRYHRIKARRLHLGKNSTPQQEHSRIILR